jgi:hypothetical protein
MAFDENFKIFFAFFLNKMAEQNLEDFQRHDCLSLFSRFIPTQKWFAYHSDPTQAAVRQGSERFMIDMDTT